MAEGSVHRLADPRLFARFRQRRLCIVVTGTHHDTGRLRNVSAVGATIDTNARPPIGATVRLQHPEAGEIAAQVCRHHIGGIGLDFALDADSVAFAVRAYAADMTDQPSG